MAITDKEKGVWGLDQVYNKINQGSIWEYSSNLKNLFTWGDGANGQGFWNSTIHYSSPVQIPGDTWRAVGSSSYTSSNLATKTDGTLWLSGNNNYGQLGQNNEVNYSSPIQIPGTTWTDEFSIQWESAIATKTDGTLWTWGKNTAGELGQSQGSNAHRSSPVQVGSGTDWSKVSSGLYQAGAIKTDGTLWTWGSNYQGMLGHGNQTEYDSPVQVPGTTWRSIHCAVYQTYATKTDGTLWSWGRNGSNQLGHGNFTDYSSPKQVGSGTDWSTKVQGMVGQAAALKTDGTLYTWGINNLGQLGHNDQTTRTTPVQIPGTTWSDICGGHYAMAALKTDNTLWVWGSNSARGNLGLNTPYLNYVSSPTQIPGTDWVAIGARHYGFNSLKLN